MATTDIQSQWRPGSELRSYLSAYPQKRHLDDLTKAERETLIWRMGFSDWAPEIDDILNPPSPDDTKEPNMDDYEKGAEASVIGDPVSGPMLDTRAMQRISTSGAPTRDPGRTATVLERNMHDAVELQTKANHLLIRLRDLHRRLYGDHPATDHEEEKPHGDGAGALGQLATTIAKTDQLLNYCISELEQIETLV